MWKEEKKETRPYLTTDLYKTGMMLKENKNELCSMCNIICTHLLHNHDSTYTLYLFLILPNSRRPVNDFLNKVMVFKDVTLHHLADRFL
jgi:hypothetical protein